MSSKRVHYELKLEGDESIIAFLNQHLPDRFDTIAEANEPRRAIAALFNGAVEASVISVRRVPARTVRKRLKR